jgi:hypothetical protein
MRNLASSAAMLTEIKEVSECRLCIPCRFIKATAEAYSTSSARQKAVFRIRIGLNPIRIRIPVNVAPDATPDPDPDPGF